VPHPPHRRVDIRSSVAARRWRRLVFGAVVAAMALALVPAAGASAALFAPASGYAVGEAPVSVAVRDLNGDGWPEVLTAGAHGVSVLKGTGDGRFGARTTFPTGGGVSSVAVKDFNGDHRADVVAAKSGGVAVMLGTGTGRLGPPMSYAAGNAWSPSMAAAGDVNGDGDPDIVTGGFGGVSVLLGRGTAGFAPAVGYLTSTAAQAIAIGEVTGDAKPDLAVTVQFPGVHAEEDSGVMVLPGSGTGTFRAPIKAFTASHTIPRTVALGDLNGDGRGDIASGFSWSVPEDGGGTDDGPGGPSVVLGSGGGTFGPPANYGFGDGSEPWSLALDDFDGDGRLDLATVLGYSPGAGSNVYVMRGTATDQLAPTIAYPGRAGQVPTALAAGDLNQDGHPDLVTATPNSNSVSVLLNTGVPEPPARVDLPKSVTFADRRVGTRSLGTHVTLRNSGGSPLIIKSLALAGTDADQFALTDNRCGGGLSPGQECTFTLTFAPTTPGAKTALVKLGDNTAGSPHRIALSANALPAPLVGELPPVSYSFIYVGDTFNEAIRVDNIGSAPLHIASVRLGGVDPGQFALGDDTCAGATVARGSHCRILVSFNPTRPGARSAAVGIDDDAPGSPHRVILTGTGIAR
jgi:hypothetical protein